MDCQLVGLTESTQFKTTPNRKDDTVDVNVNIRYKDLTNTHEEVGSTKQSVVTVCKSLADKINEGRKMLDDLLKGLE